MKKVWPQKIFIHWDQPTSFVNSDAQKLFFLHSMIIDKNIVLAVWASCRHFTYSSHLDFKVFILKTQVFKDNGIGSWIVSWIIIYLIPMQVRPPLTCTLALYKNNITLRDLNATITIRRREKIETVFQF